VDLLSLSEPLASQVKGLLDAEERQRSFERGSYVACKCNSDELTQVRVLPDMRELVVMGVSKCRGDAITDLTTAKFCHREWGEQLQPFVNSKAAMQAHWHSRVALTRPCIECTDCRPLRISGSTRFKFRPPASTSCFGSHHAQRYTTSRLQARHPRLLCDRCRHTSTRFIRLRVHS
jgi:hypothetical protein